MSAPGARRSLASTQPSFEARDLFRIPLWLLQKASYSYVPISLHFRLASLRGTLDSISVRHRTSLMETLEAHLGDTTSPKDLRCIARRHLQTLRKVQLTTIWPQIRDFAGVEAIPIEGLEHLDEALARGKGVILMTAHFGFARMIKPVLRSRGRRVLLVAKLPHSLTSDGHPDAHPLRQLTRAGKFAYRLRSPRSRSAERWRQIGGDISPSLNLRPFIRALARNEGLIILADGRRSQALQFLPVAGVEIPFAPGAVSIARSTGTPLLPTFVVDEPGRTGPASLRLVIHPPLELQVTEESGADLEVNLRRFADVFENQIRTYPHDFNWTWVRNGEFESPRVRREREASPSLGRGRLATD